MIISLEVMMRVGLLILAMTAVCHGLKASFKTDKVIELQSEKAVSSFIQSSNVRAIYFYKTDLKNLKFFFQDYDDAAESLDNYGVTLGYCNCSEESSKDVHLCKLVGVENGIHAFRAGREIEFLKLADLFDVNSIVAYILQLALLQDVPLLRNENEVGRFLGNIAGKKDLVFAYLTAIGTLDHLVFLEMAYEYKDKLQFAVSTDWKALRVFGKLGAKMKKVSTVWWMWAKDKSFMSIKHKGEFSNCHLAKFVESLLKPKMYDIPGDGLDNPFSSYDLPVVRFYYDAASKDQMYQEATVLLQYHAGSVWILLVNMDQNEAKAIYSYSGKLPAFSVQKRKKSKEKFMEEDVSAPHILVFLSETLGLKIEEPEDEKSKEEEPAKQTEQEEEPAEQVGHEEEPDVQRGSQEELLKALRQDDAVAAAEMRLQKIEMQLSLVPALTDKTFKKVVEERETAAVIILYFPFDAVSMGNLRMFGEAVDMLGKQTTLKIARVNCYDWTDVCQKEDIVIYPTLRVYRKGEKAWDYKGPQDTRAMFSTLKLLEMNLPVYETDREKLLQYLMGTGDSTLKEITNTTVVGLFKKGDKQEKEIFQQLVDSSRGRIMFVYTDNKDASKITKEFNTKVPAVILAKYHDQVQTQVVFDSKFTLENLEKFIENNKLPRLTVLTPLMFAELRMKFNEMLILFTDGSESCRQSEDTVRDIVKTQKFDNIAFSMMQVPDKSSVGYRILQLYAPNKEIPHISFVKFEKAEVYNFDTADMDITSVTNWLSSVVKGTIEPSTKLMEKEWTPLSKGFPFLDIIEWEKKHIGESGLNQLDPRTEYPDKELEESDDTDNDRPEHSTLEPHHVAKGKTPHPSNKKDEEKVTTKQTEEEVDEEETTHEHSEL